MKLRWEFLTVFLWVCLTTRAQVNYVQNPSFETISSCPTVASAINYATHWDTLKSGGGGSPDLYNACDNPSYWGVPFNLTGTSWTYQYARTGIGYAGINAYAKQAPNNGREYIQNTLIDTLIPGKTYCIRFFVSPSTGCNYGINQFGMYLDNGAIAGTTSAAFIPVSPQIVNPSSNYLLDTVNWMAVQGTFTASGNETYITIGNFAPGITTDTVVIKTSPIHQAYYYIEDVSIIPSDLLCIAGKDTSVCKNDSIYIGRPPEIGLDNVWTEISTGTQVGVGSGIWLKPDTSATYVVTQNLCGTTTSDTIRVVVNCIDGIDNIGEFQELIVFPTPANHFLNFRYQISNFRLQISDFFGNILREEEAKGKEASVDVSNLPAGIYFVNIITSQRLSTKKIIVQH